MTNRQLSRVLKRELVKRSWTVSDLARNANMNYETVRRAVQGIGSSSLDTANRLLATLGLKLITEEPAA